MKLHVFAVLLNLVVLCRWIIKARVTQKSQIRNWSNSRGEGKLFSVMLLDDSGEIKATAFRDDVDKFYDLIQPSKVSASVPHNKTI